jgi:hypothetical protein
MKLIHSISVVVLPDALLLALSPRVDGAFRRADSNADGVVDISDGIETLSVLFLGKDKKDCDDAFDSNDDGAVDLSDAVFTLNYLFLGGAALPQPSPDCGEDATLDALGCNVYALCVECYDQADLDATIATQLVDTYCIPAGQTQVTSGTLIADVCPADGAQPCGTGGETGCGVKFTKIQGTLDKATPLVSIHLEGNVTDLPIIVTNTLFGTKTTCTNDITFSGDAVVPLVVTEHPDGSATVDDLGAATVENAAVTLASEGGPICELLESLQDLFVDQLIAQLEESAVALVEDLKPEVVGKTLCP